MSLVPVPCCEARVTGVRAEEQQALKEEAARNRQLERAMAQEHQQDEAVYIHQSMWSGRRAFV